ncbi:MAG: hypothetical protein N2201_05610 [candidate division WOR-3 bacterium]|nr:hypothetical protein [candidate division WOR-3 bacterium]
MLNTIRQKFDFPIMRYCLSVVQKYLRSHTIRRKFDFPIMRYCLPVVQKYLRSHTIRREQIVYTLVAFVWCGILLTPFLITSHLMAQTDTIISVDTTTTLSQQDSSALQKYLVPHIIRNERIDYEVGMVFFEKYLVVSSQDSIYLGIEKILPLPEYFQYQITQKIIQEYQQTRETSQSQQQTDNLPFDRSGLIPDINLPRIPLFGEGSKINISGSDRISFGGRQTFSSGYTQTTEPRRLLPELEMKQALRVQVEGTVGERTKVLIDHDSERQLEGKNTVKLSYTGTEDEIVQTLEFGNTRLAIPGTAYTGDLPATKGLFGMTGKGKIGDVDLYVVASREESQGETKEFRGSMRIMTDTIFAYEFLRRTFYILPVQNSQIPITNLKVYVDDRNRANNLQENAEPAIATIYPDYPDSAPNYPYDRIGGDFALKTRGKDYQVNEQQIGNTWQYIIEFTSPLPINYAVGVSYIQGTDTIGGKISQDSLVLRLLKSTRQDTASQCWNLEMRNIYALGAKDVKLNEIKIVRYEQGTPSDPEYETHGSRKGETFIKILGLDPDADGTVEWPYFDGPRGYIIFPKLKPFADTGLSVRDDSVIYYKDYLSGNEGRRYFIVCKYSTKRTSVISLGQYDIEAGSEKVYVNDVLQTRDIDYEINYQTGELKFKKTLPPDANVKVNYEYRPIWSLAQKSLIGVRAETKSQASENAEWKIGTSLFYRQEGMPESKISLGAEPFQRLIAEGDLSYRYKTDLITSLLDRVPLLRAQTPTSLAFGIEGAMSVPNPNTRGVAYLDDFESTTITQDISNRALLWQFASVPEGKDTSSFAKSRLFWYNPSSRIRKDSIFGPNIGEEGSQYEEYLKIIFTPSAVQPESSWAGMMTCISQTGLNLRDVENLEIIMRSSDNRGRLHFSVATQIDEDAPRRTKSGNIAGYNGVEDSEDKNNNGKLDDAPFTEDTGMDTILGADANLVPGDDGNDDYDAFSNPIGSEGNRRLDREDIDGNGYSRRNDYFEWSVYLADSAYFSPLVNGWRILRIPLMDSSQIKPLIYGLPKWEDIRNFRIWFSGFDTTTTIEIYTLSFVGSKWQNAQVRGSGLSLIDSLEKVSVSQASRKSVPNYSSPFSLKRDLTTGQLEFEASLAIAYDSILPSHWTIVEKYLPSKEDYREYQSIKVYVHNDVNDPVFYFRFGGDSLNFYEYQIPISHASAVPGKDGWYELSVDLDSCVLVKFLKSSRDTMIGRYRVFGLPALSDIRYHALGIKNISQNRISGSIWVNDIRLVAPYREVGYGLSSNFSLMLSDLGSVSVGFTYSDPNFRRFSEGRGVKTGGFGTSLSYSGRVNLDRFLPAKWGVSFPFVFRRSHNRAVPKFSSKYPDVSKRLNRLTKSLAALEKSQSVSNDLSMSISKSQSRNKFLNWTLDALSFNWSQRSQVNENVLSRDTSFSQVSSVNYQISPDLSFTLGDMEISLFPNQFRVGLDIASTQGKRWSRRYAATGQDSLWTLVRTDTARTANLEVDVDWQMVEDFNFGYSYAGERDLKVSSVNADNLFGRVKLGTETNRNENLNFSYELELVEFLRPRLEYSGEYEEGKIRTAQGYSDLRNFSAGYDFDMTTDLSLSNLLSRLSENRFVNSLSSAIQDIDLNYSISGSSAVQSVNKSAPWLFRFGFVNRLDTSQYRYATTARLRSNDFSASTGLRYKMFSLSPRYNQTVSRNYYVQDVSVNQTIAWPDLTVNVSEIQRLLLGLATSSELSSSYRQQLTRSGTMFRDSLRLEGRRIGKSQSFNPLVSWQTTWKGRLTTNIATSYTQNLDQVFLSGGQLSKQKTQQRSATVSVGYALSASKGIPLPFLRRVRLSSDLNFTWNLRYNESGTENTTIQGITTRTRNDRDIRTDLGTSFRISQSVESGLSTGYSAYQDILQNRGTKSVDVNFWVLFKF